MRIDPSQLDRRLKLGRIDIKLIDVDEQILETLLEGRCTRGYLAEQSGEKPSWISQRLTRLIEHGVVDRRARSLYELETEYIEVRVRE
ncbi:hypothetical protein ACLI4U_19025 (plasmid) [Natrialbaceae archaeon A-CW2]